MRYSPIPVVAAPFGLTLGGGAEIALGANAIQAAAELYMGLVEVGRGAHPRRRRQHACCSATSTARSPPTATSTRCPS